jgi:hypothetical protein
MRAENARRFGGAVLAGTLFFGPGACAEASSGAGAPSIPIPPTTPETAYTVVPTSEPTPTAVVADVLGFDLRKHGPTAIEIRYPRQSATRDSYMFAVQDLETKSSCEPETAAPPVTYEPETGDFLVIYPVMNSDLCVDNLPAPQFTTIPVVPQRTN